jgi:hypothetical protein
MARQCPYCWDENITKVAEVPLNGTGRTRTLLECGDCERWYWEDSAEEVRQLAVLCLNLVRQPARCEDIVVRPRKARPFWSPRSKIREYNHICSACSQKLFFL